MSKVLIVDDVQENIDILRSTLSSEYQISVATNGEKALKVIKKVMPDLILLDILMPVMSGYDVIRTLKADDKFKDIPVIFITAQSELNEKTFGFELGAVDYVVKPFEALEVKSRVETHLALVESKKEVESVLSKTLIGAVGMFMEIEKHSNPLLFTMSYRIKNRASQLAKTFGVKNLWMVDIAAILSLIGLMYLDERTFDNILKGNPVDKNDYKIYTQFAENGGKLVSKIPRLEDVGQMIALTNTDLGIYVFDPENSVYAGAQIIQAAIQIEFNEAKGNASAYVLSMMMNNKQRYSIDVIQAMTAMQRNL